MRALLIAWAFALISASALSGPALHGPDRPEYATALNNLAELLRTLWQSALAWPLGQ
jgi:hypothetical protein